MSFSSHKLREAAQQRAQRRQKISSVKLMIGSLIAILILGGLILSNVAASQPADHLVEYDPSLVVYDQPLQAGHEMTAPATGYIPFLPEGGPQPKIVIEQDYFDFKQVGATEVVKHEFVIANEGEAPLTISRAYTTCACTTADFTASVIPPGKIAIVTLTFDAGYHDARGQIVRRGLIIESNDPANPQTEIWTQANVSTTP